MSDQPTLANVPSDLDLDPVVADALDFRPDPHALAPGASAQAAEQAGIPGSGPNVQAGCASGGGEHVTVVPSEPPDGPDPLPQRDGKGHFVKGNTLGAATLWQPGNLAQLRTGFRMLDRDDKLPPEFQHLVADVADFVAGCLVDEGDPHDVPTRRRALLDYRARLHRRILQVDALIEGRGIADRRGKLRLAWLQRLEGLITTAQRLDIALGLARRSKPVDTLDSIARSIAASRTERPAEATTSPDDADIAPASERVPTARAAVTPEAS